MVNWDEIKNEWETTKITLTDFAEKHDINLGTLKSRKSCEKWLRDATRIKWVASIEKQVGASKGNDKAKEIELIPHYKKHGKEFVNIFQSEYLERSQDLIGSNWLSYITD
ncbi:hypothetical protein [Lysinibacillus fusiformis]|uniref:hypothetical protein n=1 Tax=Lysinibacillus fusiformis TaxID=28031 RepID=UPI003D069DC6